MVNETLFNIIAFLSFGSLITVYIVILTRYLRIKRSKNNNSRSKQRSQNKLSSESSLETRYQHFTLDKETMESYAIKLDRFFQDTKLYLNTDLSLDLLSQEINIPKHLLTQFINRYYNKNFFQLMADYRIAHALEALKEGRNIKMDSLAYECGYNSTTSFYKYFKELVGLTPSEYRNTEINKNNPVSA